MLRILVETDEEEQALGTVDDWQLPEVFYHFGFQIARLADLTSLVACEGRIIGAGGKMRRTE